ncbi:helix-turn-helix transcriptional regulator [Oceanivirga salmonicida]|uniref:helix-turn-helix transcriptional regulator n=1 Tax=Oceanivirga salmonicida TaxID=1769291 RepID=UPI00082FBE4E|nr:AraC family transcriptional regulator [Oceanivirga salmonicida]
MKKNKDIETRINLNLVTTFTKFNLLGIGKHTVTKNYKINCSTRTKENFILFQLSLDGYGIFIKDNITYVCEKNDMFFCDIPSDALYYLPTNSKLWKIIYLEISKDFYHLYQKLIKLNNGKPIINLKNYPYIKTILLEMYNISIINKNDNNFELEKLFFTFMVELFKIFKSETKSNKNINTIKKYIEFNYQNKITLDHLAQNFYISKSYMIKKFKEEEGLTPIEYLNEYRLNVAKKLLLNLDNSIKYIAHTSGFSNSNYFTKVFKKKFNIVPREYRINNLM